MRGPFPITAYPARVGDAKPRVRRKSLTAGLPKEGDAASREIKVSCRRGDPYAFATGGDSPLDFEFHARAGGRLLPGGHHRDPCSTGRNPGRVLDGPDLECRLESADGS